MIRIVFPTEDEYDRDGDGLVDIEIEFLDNEGGSGIDPSTLIVQSSRQLGPMGTGGNDVLAAFEVVSRDADGVVLEETTEALLPRGSVTLAAAVRDLADNQGHTSLVFDLPAGVFHRFMDPGAVSVEPLAIEVVPGAQKGFLLLSRGVIPFDTRNFDLMDPIVIPTVLGLADGHYDETSERLYLVSVNGSLVAVLDPETHQLENPIGISGRATGITQGPSGLLYIALARLRASVAVVDPISRQQLRVVETEIADSLNPGFDAFITTPGLSADEQELTFGLRIAPGGARRVDSETGEILSTIDLGGSGLVPLGLAVESAPDHSRQLLYLTMRSAPPFRGVVAMDTRTGEVVRLRSTSRTGRLLTLSPSGRFLFVTLSSPPGTTDDGENWLIETETFSILERFPSFASPFGDNQPAFRDDEQVVFVPSGSGISVYLIRH